MKRFLFYCLLLLGVTAQAQQIKSPKIGYDVSCNCISIQPTVGDTSIRVYLMAKDVFPIRSDATNGVYFQYTDGDTKTTLILRPATTFNLAGTAYSGNVTGLRTAIQAERNKLNAFAAQAATPPTPLSGVRPYSSGNNVFSVLGPNGYTANQDFSGLSATRNYLWPNASGTVALSTDLGSYLPLAGGTMSGSILLNANSYSFGSLTNTLTNLYSANVIGRSGASLGLFSQGSATVQIGRNAGSNTDITIQGSTGYIGIGTANPTHSLTFPSTSTGWSIYNTADQTTNTELVRGYYAGNIFNIASLSTGTGSPRDMAFSVLGGANTFSIRTSSGTALYDFASGSFSGNGFMRFNTTLAGTSNANQFVVSASPTISQSGTAGYSLFQGYVFENTIGSSPRYLIDVGTSTAANNSGTKTAAFQVTSSATVGIGTAPISTRSLKTASDIESVTSVFAGANVYTPALRGNGGNLLFGPSAGGTFAVMYSADGNWFFGPSAVNAGYKVDINGTARVQGNLDINAGSGTSTLTLRDATITKAVGTGFNFSSPIVSTGFQTSGVVNYFGSGTYHASAVLTLNSTTQGFAPPRMTKAQILAISSPVAGLVAYATDDNVLCFYNGTAWQKCTSSAL